MEKKFTRNLFFWFAASLLLLILSSTASYISLQNLLSNARLVNHTNSVITKLEQVISDMKDGETGMRGYLATDDSLFLEPYKGAYKNALGNLNEIRDSTTDNPVQQTNAAELEKLIGQNDDIARDLIGRKSKRLSFVTADLFNNKKHMDAARIVVNRMEKVEQRLLERRTSRLNSFSAISPFLVIITAFISLLVTAVFFLRVLSDFKQKSALQKELEDKEHQTQNRIAMIKEVSEQISAGDYSIRVSNMEEDGLGRIAGHLNTMVSSLETSFDQLSVNEWLQSGIAMLNDTMIGEKDVDQLTADIISFIATYTESSVGVFYLMEASGQLKLSSSFAFQKNPARDYLNIGEGLAGQCLLTRKEILVENIGEDQFFIHFSTGNVKPRNIICVPVFHEKKIIGVMELGSLHGYLPKHLSFFKNSSENIGIAIHSSQNRKHLQFLLEETQTQSEELQMQHNELENLNSELEGNAQKLQASEEELRVQQEELLQTNSELEERTRLLEEKNQVIVERNLDIQKKAEELELSTRYKSEFMANMSHELRTPLNSILLLSRLLSENNERNLNSEQVESARVIQSSGNGLLTLIDEILDLSKIEAGKMTLEFSAISFTELLDDMRVLFNPIAAEKNLDLQFSIDEKLPALIHSDKMRIEQVLKNLLSNSLKFTPRGFVRMSIYQDAEPAYVCFRVSDSGIGIPPEKQQLIFEAFQQADGSTRRKYGGTGLGLSISRELARLLGGEIALQSETGEGSQFTLKIPLAGSLKKEFPAPHVEPLANPFQEEEKEVQESSKKIEEALLAPFIPEDIDDDRASIGKGDKVVLIVEDDTNFAKVLLKYTREKGYKGVVSVRGDQAIYLALNFKPIAILLDIVLPVKNGWQVMEELKNNPLTKPIPVHIMSSMEFKKESLMKGAVDFINKPFALEQMKEVFFKLESVLNKTAKKVLIVEENSKHAKALAYFLDTFQVNSEISDSIAESIHMLHEKEVDCVILDMGIPDHQAYQTLETVKQEPGLENVPIIVFTGKNLSRIEETKIRRYADTIVVKTAFSYQRILDEVTLFLHMVEEKRESMPSSASFQKLGNLNEILKNKTVLIADDDARNIFSLSKALEQHQMRVISALDGREALVKLKENSEIDVVLMDMMMPAMDGYQSIALIRKDPKYRNLPILAVTAKAMLGDREKCIQAGASDYISKPVDIDQLISLLRVWLYDIKN